MASQKNFALTPSVSITRSKFLRNSQHKTTLKIGEITPIYLDEVLPGDTRKIDMAALIRMATPVVPIMDNIHIDYYCFYCPNRLLWTHWKEFMGENNTSAGIYQGTEYKIPTCYIGYDYEEIRPGHLGDHLGLPLFADASGVALGGTQNILVSALPGRMYDLIYNEWFRDQNIIAPVSISLGDTQYSTIYAKDLYKAAKDSDYFTRSLPYAQKSNPVTIPLGTHAPVVLYNFSTSSPITNPTFNGFTVSESIPASSFGSKAVIATNGGVPGADLAVDLQQATAATINQLRFAFQYQKLLERDALFGTRYWEILKGHFGVSAPDASLQRPELLGHYRMNINIDQVLQTTGGDTTPSDNTLGNTAAVSCSGGKGNLCSKSFVEHGYIMILAVARHDQTYCQNVSRDWSRLVRTDFYFPEFANLGAQGVKNKELYWNNGKPGDSDPEALFGYQEAWAEYRYKPSQVTGLLRPNITGLGYWTLANNFSSSPSLSQSFIEQTNLNLKRAIGEFGFDFICDFAFKDVAVRPMPLYSVPGLIDHH